MREKLIRRIITVGVLVILVITFGATTDSFYSLRNIQQLFREAAYVGLVALCVSFIVIGGGIDLSSGGIICFAGIICARLADIGAPGIVCMLGGILVGILCGAFNGFCITKLHLNDFITTLASGYIYSGLGVFIMFRDAKGRVASPTLTNDSFLEWGSKINGWYFISIAWVILTVVVLFVHLKTRYGQHIVAVGSNEKSAEMSGINVARIKVSTYMIGGAFCGLAAGFTVAYQSTAYLNLGGSIGFEAVACCVLGGVVLGGGKGDGLGAFLGALIMTMILNGLYKYGLATSWQYICQGLIILVVILFDSIFGTVNQKRINALAQKDISEGGAS